MDIDEVETEVLGCSHAQLGGYLMSIWGLPTSLVQAVAFHHSPSQAIESEFSALTAVHCADGLVHMTQNAEARSRLDEPYLAQLGLMERVSVWHDLAGDKQPTA